MKFSGLSTRVCEAAEAAPKSSSTFVIVVFVVVVATVVFVDFVIAIKRLECKHALSLPEHAQRSRELPHGSRRPAVYRSLQPSPNGRSRMSAAETLSHLK